MTAFDCSPYIYHAPAKVLAMGRELDARFRTLPLSALRHEAGAVEVSRGAWIEASNVCRAYGERAEELYALGVVAVFSELLETARRRLS